MTHQPKFSKNIVNNPALKGQAAARKQTFGDHSRYAIWPIHTRFEIVQWFVADAYACDKEGRPEIIRQEDTLEAAISGLA